MSETITVGRLKIPSRLAVDWIRVYVDAEANRVAPEPYSYPAYDHYNAAGNDPDCISDADLLAPLLLNVKVPVRTYYALQQVRASLELGLAPVPTDLRLAEASEAEIEKTVKRLYEVLDGPRPWGLRSTTLSKILHRKRSHFLVLHDRWVRRCYLATDGPVQRDRNRSNSDYMVAVSLAIAADLKDQERAFDDIVDEVSEAKEVSRVRLLDILAWTSKGDQP